jgi:phospholipase C
MANSRQRRGLLGIAALTALLLGSGAATATSGHATSPHAGSTLPGGYEHLVVIYEENHSFDNLYGTWGKVNGQPVDGLNQAGPGRSRQRAQDGTRYDCLPQNDPSLTSPPLSNTCQDPAHGIAASHFTNEPFTIDDFIRPQDPTCPGGAPGGCTRDLVHRFYQEQYQIDGGKQDRYTTGSDAVGLTQGHYDTQKLPIWTYLHSPGAPKYVVADHFFQAAFGGSFLNHQWLIAARSPLGAGVPGATPQPASSVLDSNGMVNTYPQYKPTGPVADGQLTQVCKDSSLTPEQQYAAACGPWAVNTVQPASPPSGGGAKIALIDDTQYPNIGDRLTAAGVSWNWYAGGWDAAADGNPGSLFQYHHQPFNYFAAYAPGQPGRAHLQDEEKFKTAARAGQLPAVSFVKPYGAENEHPGYASEAKGSENLVDLLKMISNGPEADSTLVVVTYDEFGGQWDHVAPPKVDAWGPGTRIPALVLSTSLKRSTVDHTKYDTTSILAMIERSYGLAPLSTRDATVNNLAHAVARANRCAHGHHA